uniref:Uncharacterized protein n=1 Tax=Solanum lycopersicum TaxID=4081 RepID=A0A3Q7FDN8_SOLLC
MINLPPQVVGTVYFSVERPNVKRKLVNIWNSKLEAQGGTCTGPHDGQSKEEFFTNKNSKFLRFWYKIVGTP